MRDVLNQWRLDEIRKRVRALVQDGSCSATSPYVRDCLWLLRQNAGHRVSLRRYQLLCLVLVGIIFTIALIERRP